MSYAELSSQDPSPTPACIQCDGADSDIDRRLDSLAPSFLLSVQGLLQALQSHGLEFEIIETHRSFERQSQLWQQGRHPGSPGPIVTAARPGTSLHEIGLAIDLAPRVDGKLNWDLSNPIVHHAFQALGQHAKARGLQWGGDWAIADYGHIEEALIHNPLTGKP